ncbi:MAG: threonine synthase [Holosporales bacterium]|jgi:threonine synthase
MKYISTRGNAPSLGFSDVVLSGTARDGGLYVPERFIQFSRSDLRSMARLSYTQLAFTLLQPYVGNALSEEDLRDILIDSYGDFDHAAIAPMVQLEDNLFALELFHGPTLAFKDYALQFLGRLFDTLLSRSRRHITVIGATSGDTGSAAIAACRDKKTMDIFILHPEGRTSAIQRRQMTTVNAPNVHNIAVKGTFDDCQDIVKGLFADTALTEEMHLTAINSINWARILAQVVYYFYAALRLGAPERPVAFTVPTGNFGNVYAGWVARQMGLPIIRLNVATNHNDILTRFFNSGEMTINPVRPSASPSMDIQISSNFERLLFEIYGRDGGRVATVMKSFRNDGTFALSEADMKDLRQIFTAHRIDDTVTLTTIRDTWQRSGYLLDPHTAVGIAAAQHNKVEAVQIALACAHPAKFPDVVLKATGVTPAIPARLQSVLTDTEHFETQDNSLSKIRQRIRGQHARVPA